MLNANDVLNGKYGFSSGDGKFAAIRELAVKALPKKDSACEFKLIVKQAEKQLKLPSSQQAYNYSKNALEKDSRFFIFRTPEKRLILIRVDGDIELIKKLAEKSTPSQ